MNLKPLGDRVILKVLEAEENRQRNLPADNAKEKPQQGKVLQLALANTMTRVN